MGSCVARCTTGNRAVQTPEPSPLFEKNNQVVFPDVVYAGTVTTSGAQAYTVTDSSGREWYAPKGGIIFSLGDEINFKSDMSRSSGSGKKGKRYYAVGARRVQ